MLRVTFEVQVGNLTVETDGSGWTRRLLASGEEVWTKRLPEGIAVLDRFAAATRRLGVVDPPPPTPPRVRGERLRRSFIRSL